MANETIEERVKRVLIEQCQVNSDQISPEARFKEDLHADSLTLVEINMAFEEEFDLEIPDEEAEKIKTVKGAVDYLKSKMPR